MALPAEVAEHLDAHREVTLYCRDAQGGPIEVPLWEFDLPDHATIDAHDEVTGADFSWQGKMQHVWLPPHDRPYAIWSLKNPGVAQA